MAKEETVLQGMIDRLIEIGRCYGMEMVERIVEINSYVGLLEKSKSTAWQSYA
jgi:hypothetical protein